MEKYSVDAFTLYGKKILKSFKEKELIFEDRESTWDFVGWLDEKYPLGQFVAVIKECD